MGVACSLLILLGILQAPPLTVRFRVYGRDSPFSGLCAASFMGGRHGRVCYEANREFMHGHAWVGGAVHAWGWVLEGRSGKH